MVSVVGSAACVEELTIIKAATKPTAAWAIVNLRLTSASAPFGLRRGQSRKSGAVCSARMHSTAARMTTEISVVENSLPQYGFGAVALIA